MFLKFLLFLISTYKKVSHLKPQSCRFHPTCSEYAYQAVSKYGYKGIFTALIRILRCNQFFKGGYDPLI